LYANTGEAAIRLGGLATGYFIRLMDRKVVGFMRQKLTPSQILLGTHLKELGYKVEYERRVCLEHKWRWDVCILEPSGRDTGIAIEIDGFYKGKHGAGFGSDYEKQNTGVMGGMRVLRFTNKDVLRGKAKDFLARYL
jgi:very-short-patch-repair endonuclease